MDIKLRLKDCLIHLFRQPVLLLSANCGGCRSSPARKKKKSSKKEIRVRENGKLYMTGYKADQEGRTCPPSSPSSPSCNHYCYFKEEEKNKATKKKKKKKTTTTMMMASVSKRCELFSSSAMESVDDLGFFSSHEEEEEEESDKEEDIEAFLASRSLSPNCSDFYQKAKKMESFAGQAQRRRRERKSRCIWVNGGFEPLVSISRSWKEEERREASFAVTKQSSDPYGDFQSSMVEMIVERKIFGAGELQWLLHAYLSLNSVQNHPVILRAFVDVSQVLFGY